MCNQNCISDCLLLCNCFSLRGTTVKVSSLLVVFVNEILVLVGRHPGDAFERDRIVKPYQHYH